MPLVRKHQRYLSRRGDRNGVAETSDDISNASFFTEVEARVIAQAMNTFATPDGGTSGGMEYPGSIVPDKKALEIVRAVRADLEERIVRLNDLEVMLSTTQPDQG